MNNIIILYYYCTLYSGVSQTRKKKVVGINYSTFLRYVNLALWLIYMWFKRWQDDTSCVMITCYHLFHDVPCSLSLIICICCEDVRMTKVNVKFLDHSETFTWMKRHNVCEIIGIEWIVSRHFIHILMHRKKAHQQWWWGFQEVTLFLAAPVKCKSIH